MILVVAPANDIHYRCVAEQLRRMGKTSWPVDVTRLGNEARLSVSTGNGRRQKWSVPDQADVDLGDAECIWYRRLYSAVLRPAPARKDDEDWAVREWRDATLGSFMATEARAVSDPIAQLLAAMKPYQLRMAQEVGLSVPDTLMTNDESAARAFLRDHGNRVIHKVVTTPRERWVPTRRWNPEDESELRWLYLTPTFFQEEVVAPQELRVTVVGRRVFAAEFAVPAGVTDARPDLDCDYKEHRLPDEVAERLLALMDRLNLHFGTIDMRRRADGEYVFLEVNPQGQFLYVEIKTGMPIVQAMAELLANRQG